MKRKISLIIVCLSILIISLCGCDNSTNISTTTNELVTTTTASETTTSTTISDIFTVDESSYQYQIYLLAQSAGVEMTYEEWLELIKGEDGADGKDGKDGTNGTDGTDGTDGEDGLSAYEIYKKYNPTYTGTEEEWITAVANGSLISSTVYENLYNQIKNDLYDDIYREIIDEISESVIPTDTLVNVIKDTCLKAQSTNVLVTTYVIRNNEPTAYATGSGVVYLKENNSEGSDNLYTYYVITNEHVVADGSSYTIQYEDEETIDCTLMGSDETTDLALLSFESNEELAVATLGDENSVSAGDIVIACGNPKGETLYNSVTFGICGGTDRNLKDSDGTINTRNKYVQHDAAINSGNSGGGLYNLKGELIGINSVKYTSSDIEGLNFAIPVQLVSEVIAELKEYGSYSGTVSLGITSTDINRLTYYGRSYYSIPNNIYYGLYVVSVSETGSSYNVLEEGDIILSIDDVTITNSSVIQTILNSHVVGDTVSIKIIRSGTEQTVSLTFIRGK